MSTEDKRKELEELRARAGGIQGRIKHLENNGHGVKRFIVGLTSVLVVLLNVGACDHPTETTPVVPTAPATVTEAVEAPSPPPLAETECASLAFHPILREALDLPGGAAELWQHEWLEWEVEDRRTFEERTVLVRQCMFGFETSDPIAAEGALVRSMGAYRNISHSDPPPPLPVRDPGVGGVHIDTRLPRRHRTSAEAITLGSFEILMRTYAVPGDQWLQVEVTSFHELEEGLARVAAAANTLPGFAGVAHLCAAGGEVLRLSDSRGAVTVRCGVRDFRNARLAATEAHNIYLDPQYREHCFGVLNEPPICDRVRERLRDATQAALEEMFVAPARQHLLQAATSSGWAEATVPAFDTCFQQPSDEGAGKACLDARSAQVVVMGIGS